MALAAGGVALIAFAALQPKPAPEVDVARMDAARASAQAVASEQASEKAARQREASVVRVKMPDGRPFNIFWAGDSLTAGFSAVKQTDGFRFRVNRYIEKWGPVEEYVATKPAAEPLFKVGVIDQDSIPKAGIDLAMIELGTNDAGRTDLDAFESSYRSLLTRVLTGSPKAKVVCVGAWGVSGPNGTDRYDAIIERECDRRGGLFLDMTDLYMNKELTGPKGVETFAGPRDEFHPNDFGHEDIAKRLISRIKVSR